MVMKSLCSGYLISMASGLDLSKSSSQYSPVHDNTCQVNQSQE